MTSTRFELIRILLKAKGTGVVALQHVLVHGRRQKDVAAEHDLAESTLSRIKTRFLEADSALGTE